MKYTRFAQILRILEGAIGAQVRECEVTVRDEEYVCIYHAAHGLSVGENEWTMLTRLGCTATARGEILIRLGDGDGVG